MKQVRPLSCLMLAMATALSVAAQRDDVNKMAVMLARDQTSMTVGRVRYDLVGMNHPTLDDPSTLLLRVARKTPEGWSVRVYTGEGGHLIMTGTFSDEALTMAEGVFTFHHPNGQVESTGTFHNGLKTGVWKRYDARGTPLADRVYDNGALTTEPVRECGSTLSCKP